jgi:hypothetical protein
MCPFWWPACPKVKRLWPMSPSSLNRCGCARQTRSSATKPVTFFIIFPTIRTLQRLTPFANVQAVLDACALNDEPLWTSCPRAGWLAGKEERYMEP